MTPPVPGALLLRVALLAIAAAPILSAEAEDIAGSKDHPLVRRYEGSRVVWYAQKSYAAMRLALEPLVFDYNDGKMSPYQKLDVEGRKTTIYYSIPAGVGPLEAIRNYENELKEKGFEILFSASGDNLERNKGDNIAAEIYGVAPSNPNRENPDMRALTVPDRTKSHYTAAKLTRAIGGDVYASVFAIEAAWTAAGAFDIPEKTSSRDSTCAT